MIVQQEMEVMLSVQSTVETYRQSMHSNCEWRSHHLYTKGISGNIVSSGLGQAAGS